MFLTPRMPSDEYTYYTATAAPPSPSPSPSPSPFVDWQASLDADSLRQRHQFRSQRGMVGRHAGSPLYDRPRVTASVRDYTAPPAVRHHHLHQNGRRDQSHDGGRTHFELEPPRPSEPLTPPPPPHTTAMTTSGVADYGSYAMPTSLPHRSAAGRRERRVIGRTSPYARPQQEAAAPQPMPQYTFPSLSAPPVRPDASYRSPLPYPPPPPPPAAAHRHVPSSRQRTPDRPMHGYYPLHQVEPHAYTHAAAPVAGQVDLRHGSPTAPLWPRALQTRTPSPPPPPAPSLPASSAAAAAANTPTLATPPSTADAACAPLVDEDLTLVGQLCAKRNCYRQACSLYGEFCEFHKPSRLCKVPECKKCAKTGGFCIAHGGGRRCQHGGCTKSAKEGGLCIAHGGGKRRQHAHCDKAAAAAGLCASHAGAGDTLL